MSGLASPLAVARPTARPWDFDQPGTKAPDRDLRGRTVRGALASGLAQAAGLCLRTGSIVLLSRLLSPRDFGLVAMATSAIGFLSLFRDFGLSTASVQRADVTEDQVAGLFWINLLAGVGLAAACAAAAPALVRFYGEPRLFLITLALAMGFAFNGATVQHRALLQRQMRFASLAVIDTVGLAIAIVASIAIALAGLGPWAVVSMTICPQVVALAGVWIVARWVPGRPRRGSGLRPLLRFGGTLTLNSLVVYVAYNADKILLGRFWGTEALGLYSRAYQLLSLATDSLNSAVAQVALPALARVQHDPPRRRRYFLLGYGVFLALAVPLTVACAFFAEDIVLVFLGPKWAEAAVVFRLLTPTMLVFAVINPLAWLMLATGRTGRSLAIALMIAPAAIAGYSLGLSAGPRGVALGFSSAMLLLAVPVVLWAIRGMALSARDVAGEVFPPLLSAVAGGAIAFAVSQYMGEAPALLRLTAECAVLGGVFLALLSLASEKRATYWKMVRDSNLLPASPGRVG